MSTYSDEPFRSGQEDTPTTSSGIPRRGLLKMPLGFAAGAIAMPALFGRRAHEATANGTSEDLILAPRYYPLRRFQPELDLRGKLAVVTGASRGNGRAIAEALAGLGVDVIGTSRHPKKVPNRPSFPLLTLDIADSDSVIDFATALTSHRQFQAHGQVDILVNNAGRFVLGQIVPAPTDFSTYLESRDLGIRTIYSGHVMVTNVMLPLMSPSEYSRIIFIVSVTSYYTGATFPPASFLDTYTAGKMALRVYANNLDATLQLAGSNIRVSAVHPYAMRTGLAEHPNPIYAQAVNNQGLSYGSSVQ